MMAEQEQRKSSPLKWILIIAIPLIIIAGGAAFFVLTTMMNGDNISPGEPGTVPIQNLQLVSLDPLAVNLADPGGRRYLRTEIVLEFPANRHLERELEAIQHRVTHTAISVLRSKRVVDLNDMESVSQELKNAINEQLQRGEITGLYFENFVIQ